MTPRLSALAAALLLTPVIAARGEVTPGEMLALPCFGCHGPEGVSGGAIPSIDGDSAEEIAVKMGDFQDGSARATIMTRIARGYTDAEIRLIADYLATLRGKKEGNGHAP